MRLYVPWVHRYKHRHDDQHERSCLLCGLAVGFVVRWIQVSWQNGANSNKGPPGPNGKFHRVFSMRIDVCMKTDDDDA
jgi:hypothetical protein